MRPRQYKQLLCLATLALLCGGATCDSNGGSPSAQDASASDAGSLGDAGSSNAKCVDVPDFHIGMQALGNEGLVLGELVDADPVHKYENDWVVKLTDPAGAPIAGLDLYQVQPFMPAHGHDGTFDPEVSEGSDPGTYDVKRINLWMQDQWEVRFFVHVGDKDDEVIFNVCVPP